MTQPPTPGATDPAEARAGSTFLRYLTSFPAEMALGTDDPEAVLDRYCTPDFDHTDGGTLLDRERLVAHARPARRNVLALRVDVHDTLVDGRRAAARYTLHTSMRQGYDLSTEVYLFADLAEDGRLRRAVSTTRSLGDDAAGEGASK